MSNPYEFELNGLRIVIYAENKDAATVIFNQKIEEYNESVLENERLKVLEEVRDLMTFHQEGSGGYFTITTEDWERL